MILYVLRSVYLFKLLSLRHRTRRIRSTFAVKSCIRLQTARLRNVWTDTKVRSQQKFHFCFSSFPLGDPPHPHLHVFLEAPQYYHPQNLKSYRKLAYFRGVLDPLFGPFLGPFFDKKSLSIVKNFSCLRRGSNKKNSFRSELRHKKIKNNSLIHGIVNANRCLTRLVENSNRPLLTNRSTSLALIIP